jgi:hypothetical protein
MDFLIEKPSACSSPKLFAKLPVMPKESDKSCFEQIAELGSPEKVLCSCCAKKPTSRLRLGVGFVFPGKAKGERAGMRGLLFTGVATPFGRGFLPAGSYAVKNKEPMLSDRKYPFFWRMFSRTTLRSFVRRGTAVQTREHMLRWGSYMWRK